VGGSELKPGGNYWHPQLQGTVWSTIPESIPADLHRRYMTREGIRKKALLAQSVVYYIRMPESSIRAGCIKIGHTRDLTQRLWQLQDRYGGAPEVLATEPGSSELEDDRHSRFSHLSMGGFNEYFSPGQDLLSWIDQVLMAWGPPMITGPLPVDWPWPE
jgi:hypothetical protein